ncbi:uncharacterized protein PHACADRAFT_180501 [Phanerochaete carnosa HHB-10118-sp]|uniref:Uncharacterized protein n=1 Tax=Phanerochaete carnosa (strain HHB-10118-sp) TaxID=650164 RepID=K5VEG1_PHACS|nr:uncharacterized protein PHACADRAFT_180501 [Phanerochaete carnosa HHB-10118-sp]EKM61376.1 hypothetical protein PHACADRAFT_180501 [Phanerochaete carnosa HHB-10118-sp]
MGRPTRTIPAFPTSPTYSRYTYTPNEEVKIQPPKEEHCVRCHATFTDDDGSRCRVPHVYKPESEADWCSQGIKGCFSLCCGSASVKIQGLSAPGERKTAVIVEKLGDPYCHDGWEHTIDTRDIICNRWSFEVCRYSKEGRCVAKVVQEPEGTVIFKDKWDVLRWGKNTGFSTAPQSTPSPFSTLPIPPIVSAESEVPLTVVSMHYHCDGLSTAVSPWSMQ